MAAFKEAFSETRTLTIGRAAARAWPGFPLQRFQAGLGKALEPLELKQRVSLIADRLADGLPSDPAELFPALVRMLADEETHGNDPAEGLEGFLVWPLTELVARFGLEQPELAFPALREMTIRFTSEFAIRPFLRRDPNGSLSQMAIWADDPNPHVRRLASEGSRPILPWGMRLPELLAPPFPTLDLLEKLHRDDSPYVRLSVANHLNDFSKFHPELVLFRLRHWLRETPDDPNLRKLARHACRTLVKSGHGGALELLGAAPPGAVELQGFWLQSDRARLGERLEFGARLRNLDRQTQHVVLDYRLHLLRANGCHQGKVFKWRALKLGAGETVSLQGWHHFREVTTRRHYPGRHFLQLQVNGQLSQKLDFMLEPETL